MAEHQATIDWQRDSAAFVDRRYSRGHYWEFDGGIRVPASSSPHMVPVPYSVVAAVDPEEAFVAALSSCHMLWFLALAAKRGIIVDHYRDTAVGVMGRDDSGKLAMLEVTLHLAVTFAGDHQPNATDLTALHHAAHAECFLANSVKTHIRYEPVDSSTDSQPTIESP